MVEKGLNLTSQIIYEDPSSGSGSVVSRVKSYAPFSKYREAVPFTLESKGSVRLASLSNWVFIMFADRKGVIAVPKNSITRINGIADDIIFLLDNMVSDDLNLHASQA